MSYSIDLYRGEIEQEESLLRFATFVSFFPQLVAGPIVRASEFLPQLRKERYFDWPQVRDGFGQVLLGFFKKVVIADSIAPVVDKVFEYPETHSAGNVLLAVVLYAFQIYGDFAGYSDIAIGLAKMLGFEFPQNFRFPYFADSFSDFWSRWHITLSSWLRDYLYIPLGGNRGGTLLTFRNLMLTMLLGGLWHGASWTFVFWGALHGGYLIVQRVFGSASSSDAPRFVSCVASRLRCFAVFFSVCLAWVFFRSPDFETASLVLGRITSFDGIGIRNKLVIGKCCLLVITLVAGESITNRYEIVGKISRSPGLQVVLYASLLWSISFFGTFGGNAFIYFQF